MIQCPWELSVVPRNQIVWRLWWPEWNNYSNCNNQSFHVYPNLFVHTVRISLTFPPDLISCLFFLQPLVCICPGHHRLLSFPLMIVWSPCIFCYPNSVLTWFSAWLFSISGSWVLFMCCCFLYFCAKTLCFSRLLDNARSLSCFSRSDCLQLSLTWLTTPVKA